MNTFLLTILYSHNQYFICNINFAFNLLLTLIDYIYIFCRLTKYAKTLI